MLNIVKFFFWATTYKIILELVYYFFVAPNYSYSGLIWRPSFSNFIISYLIFFCLLILLPRGQKRPSHQLTQLLFFIIIIPILSFYWQTDRTLTYVIYVTFCCFILFLILNISKPFNMKLLKIDTTRSLSLVNSIFMISLLLLILFTLIYGGMDLRTLNFSAAYDLREETEYGLVWGYLVNWLGKVLIPFCIVMYTLKNKKLLLFLSCIMQIYLYLCTGNKSTLFSVLFLVFFTFVLKKNKFLFGIPTFYTIAIILSTIFFTLTRNLYFIAILPIRQLNIPAQLNFVHYEFFSKNPKLLFSEGLIGKVFGINSPYDLPAAVLVSRAGENANTGFLGDAYDNGGFIAMILLTFLLAIIFLFIDSISQHSIERYKYTAFSLYTIIIITDTGLLTTLLTSGTLILLLLLYILASEERNISSVT